jgi:hypothetical protein
MSGHRVSRSAVLVLLGAVAGVILVAVAAGVGTFLLFGGPSRPREPLRARLDPSGPYLILASRQAAEPYAAAIARAKELHPDAFQATFDPGDLAATLELLRQRRPRYAMVFVKPEELDVDFAWRWLILTTQVDDDPLVDVRTGFITGATPETAAALVERIARAVRGEVTLPAALVDNWGPNSQASKQAFYMNRGALFVPALDQRLALQTTSHGTEGFTDERLTSLRDAGLIHLGGHGHPERVDDGITGTQVRRAPLSPCVVFSGACYTGVTGRWYDPFGPSGKVAVHTVKPDECFALNLLDNQALAYLAALHVDHGIPVYQELEYLAYGGASLGDVIKHTHDGVILGAGGRVPRFKHFEAGMATPHWTPSDIMLEGTASRVLFGDPALMFTEPCVEPPFRVEVTEEGDGLRITATLNNPQLKSTYTDTYHADLAADPNLFNDRALLAVDLPAGWSSVSKVGVLGVDAGGKSVRHRLVGYAVESDGDRHTLHVQVDVPTSGYMESPFRVAGATVRLRASR